MCENCVHRFVNEYSRTLASAIGARINVKRFSIDAANRNNAAKTTVNAHTKPTESSPAGIAREAVRGLRASNRLSEMRLKAIAAERAPTIATTIQVICHAVGTPFAASTAPRNANGNAKSVCSILIISRVSRVFLISVDTAGQSNRACVNLTCRPAVSQAALFETRC